MFLGYDFQVKNELECAMSVLQKIEERKKRIRELEIRAKKLGRKKRLVEFQSLANKAGLLDLDLDSTALFGALLEISESSKDLKTLNRWKERGAIKTEDKIPVAISFKTSPSQEIKDSLKDLKFRWNSFRREYYGSGDISVLKSLLKNVEHEVITI